MRVLIHINWVHVLWEAACYVLHIYVRPGERVSLLGPCRLQEAHMLFSRSHPEGPSDAGHISGSFHSLLWPGQRSPAVTFTRLAFAPWEPRKGRRRSRSCPRGPQAEKGHKGPPASLLLSPFLGDLVSTDALLQALFPWSTEHSHSHSEISLDILSEVLYHDSRLQGLPPFSLMTGSCFLFGTAALFLWAPPRGGLPHPRLLASQPPGSLRRSVLAAELFPPVTS